VELRISEISSLTSPPPRSQTMTPPPEENPSTNTFLGFTRWSSRGLLADFPPMPNHDCFYVTALFPLFVSQRQISLSPDQKVASCAGLESLGKCGYTIAPSLTFPSPEQALPLICHPVSSRFDSPNKDYGQAKR